MSDPIDLFDMFGHGLLAYPGESTNLLTLLRGHVIGAIHIESGEIAVADPYLLDEVAPLARRCPVGVFPVLIAEAEQDSGCDTAGLCVRFRDIRPTSWEPAGGVSIDSASVVIGDAAHAVVVTELAARDGAMPLPLGYAVFRAAGTEVAAGCLIGSSGGYPVLWGLDGDGVPVMLCVPIERPDHYTRWQPPERCPPLPDVLSVEACAAWALAIPGYLQCAGAISSDDLAAIERFAGRRAPPEVLAFYRSCAPWRGDGLVSWEAIATAAGYAAGGGAFPLWASSRDFAQALVPVGDRFAVRTLSAGGAGAFWHDIPAWLLLQGISLVNLES